MTERRTRNGLAPSIIAASSRSRGIDRKYWRSRNTLNAFAKKCGTINGSQVPFQPSFVNTAYVGISVTWNGRMIVAIRMTNRMFFAGNRKRAKPYATRAEDRTVPIVLRIDTAAVLKSSLGKLSCDQTVLKLLSFGSNTHDCWSVRQAPCQTIGARAGSAGSTNVLSLRPFLTSIRFLVAPAIGTS